MSEETEKEDSPRGPGSFCIPRAVINALLSAKASAYEICAYLVLARFTDESGMYSTAGISAVNRYTGANKVKGGPIDKAIKRLLTIPVNYTVEVPNGLTGRKAGTIKTTKSKGPILIDRETWLSQPGRTVPDGPVDHSRVLFILPTFDEAVDERVWFGGNIVTGVGTFDQPLKVLKNAGDVAARLLLDLYAKNDMEIWGGVCPVGAKRGPWCHYKPIADDVDLDLVRLIRTKHVGEVAQISKAIADDDQSYWRALEALQSAGFIYETVMVLNRNALKSTFASGGEYSGIPEDAEPLYELDTRSKHGYKPEGEEGVGGATARTAGQLGRSVTLEGGVFDGTYAAIIPTGFPAMIAGIYRLRFRVSNKKNAGVRNAWARIYEGNKEALVLIEKVRSRYGLPPLTD